MDRWLWVCMSGCVCIYDISSNKTYPQARECTERVEEGKKSIKAEKRIA